MAKQWRCAVVGTSLVGQTHVRVLPQIPNITLAAVCDLQAERARAALEKANLTNIPVYTDLAEMLRREQIDVVTLATPSGAHLGPAMTAMQAGKHVICEKPLEIQLDRVDEMIDAARRHGVKLACVFQNRWMEANRAIRAAAEERRFGTLAWAGCFTPWYRTDAYYEESGWRGTWKMDGGGAVMNQSIHLIDLLQWIAGPVRRVSAYASSRIHPKIEVEDTLSCSLQFENGAYGSIVGTTAMFPGLPARLEIGGENGTAVSENGLKFFKFRDERPGDGELLSRLAPTTGPAAKSGDVTRDLHFRSFQAILGAWAEGREAETHGAESRKAVAIVLAMYQSARENGAPVDVK